jgi:hypothetical protein
MLSGVAAPAGSAEPAIVHRIFKGWLTHQCQDVGLIGTLTAHNPTCIYTIIPGCYDNLQRGSLGGYLMNGSGSCPGTFQLILIPQPGWNFGNPGQTNPSDYGATGRFDIESADPSVMNPGGYTTETTGTYTILQSYEHPTGESSAPTAIELDGITTTRKIN